MRWSSLRLRLVAGGIAAILLALIVAGAGLILLFERHVARTLSFICRSSSLRSPAVMTDDACPAERRTIERSRASNSSIWKGFGNRAVSSRIRTQTS